jgi:hypothetical protein
MSALTALLALADTSQLISGCRRRSSIRCFACGAGLLAGGCMVMCIINQRDYHIGTTRVVCNPRGYVDEPNFGFDDRFCLDL